MPKSSYTIYISKRKEHSYARFDIRVNKDACLYDDVHDFMSRNPAKLNELVDKLLNNRFFHNQYTDPEYPI